MKTRTVVLDFSGPAFPKHGVIASEVKPKDVSWMWWPRIPQGAITIIGARGGTGKGVCLCDIAARISTGAEWPFSDGERAPLGNVMWCETEDTFNTTVVPRLIASGADLRRVILVKPKEFFSIDLRARIAQEHVCLIVFSPLNSFLEDLADANSGQGVREALETIQSAIEDTPCAVIGICHLNKKTDLDAIERLLGSVEYVNFVRSVLLMRVEDDENKRLVHVKYNLAVKANDLTFSTYNTKPIKHPRGQYITVKWGQPDGNVDETTMYAQKDKRETASQWLLNFLRDDEQECQQIFQRGEMAGHTREALLKAKDRHSSQIGSRTTGFGTAKKTYWNLKRVVVS